MINSPERDPLTRKGLRPQKIAPYLLVLLTVLMYLSSVKYQFVWDDHHLIEGNAQIQEIGNLPKSFATGFLFFSGDNAAYYRPFITMSYMIDFLLWKNLPPGYHLTNILLQIAVCLLVYFTALKLLRHFWAAFIAAALFAVHPVHVESVVWISGRTDILAALFLLPSFIFYMRHTSAKSGQGWLILSALFLLFSLLSKETVIVFPFVWLIYGLGVARRRPAKLLMDAAAFAAVVGIYLLLRHSVQLFYLTPEHIIPWQTRIPAIAANLLTALRLMYFNLVSQPYHRFAFSISVPLWLLVVQWTALAAALVGYVSLWRRSRTAAFAITWTVVAVWPVSHIVPLARPILAERFLYMGTIGACLSIGVGARYLLTTRPKTAPALAVLSAAMIALWSAGTVVGSRAWQDEISLWTKVCELADRGPAAECFSLERAEYHNNLSMALYGRQKYERALECALRALRINLQESEAYMMAGLCLNAMGRKEEALGHFENAVAIAPDQPRLLANYGAQLMEVGRYAEAVEVLTCAANTRYAPPEVLSNLSHAYQQIGEWEESRKTLRRGVDLWPRDVVMRGHYALALQRVGRFEEAVEQWEFIIREAQGSPEADLAAAELLKLRQETRP